MSKMLVFWCVSKKVIFYLLIDILPGLVENSNPQKLEPVRTSFEYLHSLTWLEDFGS
jgi:hypothetical protein